MSKTLALKPRMSEKTYAVSQTQNTFVFDVPTTANKHEIAAAVASQFNVTVEDVRIAVMKGKVARSIRIGSRTGSRVSGKRANIKKAYVKLKEGDSIPVFAAIEEAEVAQAKLDEKAAKKSAAPNEDKTQKAEARPKRGLKLGLKKTARGGDK